MSREIRPEGSAQRHTNLQNGTCFCVTIRKMSRPVSGTAYARQQPAWQPEHGDDEGASRIGRLIEDNDPMARLHSLVFGISLPDEKRDAAGDSRKTRNSGI
jgi:hypothetical protein